MSTRLRSIRDDEGGFTLAELMITLMIMSVSLAVTLGILVVTQNLFSRQLERSTSNDQVRLAMEQLDREIRSGSVLRNPAAESPAYFSLRVYTQSNAQHRCVQWRVEDGRLERRSWAVNYYPSPPDPATVDGWRTVAEGLANEQAGVNVFEPAVVVGGKVRTVHIILLVNERYEQRPQSTVRVDQSITGRNTVFAYPDQPCEPVPT